MANEYIYFMWILFLWSNFNHLWNELKIETSHNAWIKKKNGVNRKWCLARWFIVAEWLRWQILCAIWLILFYFFGSRNRFTLLNDSLLNPQQFNGYWSSRLFSSFSKNQDFNWLRKKFKKKIKRISCSRFQTFRYLNQSYGSSHLLKSLQNTDDLRFTQSTRYFSLQSQRYSVAELKCAHENVRWTKKGKRVSSIRARINMIGC